MTAFSRPYRLVNKEDFQSVFANPRKISHKSLISLYKPNQLAHARLGLIISKQRVKLAAERNYIKRIIRESFRIRKQALKGLDIIVLMRSEWSPQGKKALRDDIDHLWLLLETSSN